MTPCAQAVEKQDSHMVLFSWSLRKVSFLYLPKTQLCVHPSIHSGNFSGMYVYIYAKKCLDVFIANCLWLWKNSVCS